MERNNLSVRVQGRGSVWVRKGFQTNIMIYCMDLEKKPSVYIDTWPPSQKSARVTRDNMDYF